ncbi:hypothetical protein B0A48_13188 [Cryoendolithus antarcticus]|uniref:Peptidase A1 domain-containing protein n=1 Tax=Cryoendolithus antarcticus TaxID=1507870 RepID=A0A1V8SNT5_9PEZI|nr:hypothetical protein B0A48_13188 [Cryoendolithus antarcticus]
MVHRGFNTTRVYDENTYCDLATSLACTTYRGGQYDPRNSTSSVSGLSSSSAGGPSLEETDLETATWVQDNLTLGSNFTLPAFPLAIPRQSVGDVFGPQVGLGLDFNSTLLTTARNTGRIASRTWSYFWGETGTADDASNGALVLGGYDAAKTVGQNYTQRLTYGLACEDGLLVAITDLSMVFPNDTAVSLFGAASPAQRACIHPGATSLPDITYQKFEEVTGFSSDGQRSTGVNYNSTLFPAGARFDGDLRITINSVLDITVKNGQFIQPHVTIDDAGHFAASLTVDELLIISYLIHPLDFTVGLGRQFFSAAMLMVNQEAKTFTLWQAKPSLEQDLVAIDPSGSPIYNSSCSSVTESTVTDSGPVSGTATVTVTPKPKSLSTGAIVGIVVGGVALLGLIAGIIVFLRHKRAQRNIRPPSVEAELLSDRFAERTSHYEMQAAERHELPVGNWIGFIAVATVSPLSKSLSDRAFHFRRGASSTPYNWRLRFTDKMIMDRGDLVLARHEAEVERLELVLEDVKQQRQEAQARADQKFILSMNTNVDDYTSIAMSEQAISLAGDISRVAGRVREGLEKYPDDSARKEELATLTVELRSAGEKIDKAMEEADKQMD